MKKKKWHRIEYVQIEKAYSLYIQQRPTTMKCAERFRKQGMILFHAFFVSSYTYTQKESERNEKEALKSFLLYFAIGATNKWLNKWNRRSFSFLCLLWSHFYLGFFSLFIVVVTLFSKCSLHSSRISTALSLRCLCVLSLFMRISNGNVANYTHSANQLNPPIRMVWCLI